MAGYYRLKFAVNDLCIKIFKQICFVWEQCPSNSNYTWSKTVCWLKGCDLPVQLNQKCVYIRIYILSHYCLTFKYPVI